MAEKSLQIFEIAADLAISGCKCIPQRMQIARTKTSQFKHRQKVYFATNCTPELVLAQSPKDYEEREIPFNRTAVCSLPIRFAVTSSPGRSKSASSHQKY